MESNNYNLDSTLGGSERLPHSANSLKFSASRSIEIAAMTESILRPSKTKLIFQTLPVHMRRRVMSHNCKRLPRKLRQGHFEQLRKSGLPPKQKRPSRKYRRRPTNLLKEYERRQRTHEWLESHIWHAKRFHMCERWGYRLARAPCDKAFRACYRASSAHCLLQDISYLECLQICGDITEIESAFKVMTDSSCGLGMCARAYSSGCREGSAHVYKPKAYPNSYIGKIDFLWKPNDGTEAKRTLWVFAHTSFYQELYDAVLESFSFGADDDYEVPGKRRKPNTDVVSNDRVTLTQPKHKLNRFRLSGPKSHAVVVRSVKFVEEMEGIAKDEWVQQHGAGEELRLQEKRRYWESMRHAGSPAELPTRMVLGAVVRDPRLSRPPKRTKAQLDAYLPPPSETLVNVPSHAATSPLWDLSVHDKILSRKWSDRRLIEHATVHQLVPGEPDESNPAVQSIPVIMIQRPGSQCPNVKKLGYGSGWDIIIPAGYSLAFWRTFIMFGGRAGGLRESESVARESGQCYFPPDCAAGREEEQRTYREMREKYFRLPPNKRVNYIKFGINSPFLCRWDVLLKDWSKGFDGDIFVMRNKATLKRLQDSIEMKTVVLLELLEPCLVPVFIKVTSKGNLSPHTIICLPKAEDTRAVKPLFEPCHVDSFEKERKLMRKENRAKLKKLRRQRVKLKKSGSKMIKMNHPVSKPQLSEYALKMHELWLPTDIATVRNSASREVMGYVCQGGFSYTEGCSAGVGYVASEALRELLARGQHTVLVRNTKSRKYSTAAITIITAP